MRPRSRFLRLVHLLISSQWHAPTRRPLRACLPPRAMRASRAPRALRASRSSAGQPACIGAFDQRARIEGQGAGLPPCGTVRTGRISRLGRRASRAPHPAPSRQLVADAGGPDGAVAPLPSGCDEPGRHDDTGAHGRCPRRRERSCAAAQGRESRSSMNSTRHDANGPARPRWRGQAHVATGPFCRAGPLTSCSTTGTAAFPAASKGAEELYGWPGTHGVKCMASSTCWTSTCSSSTSSSTDRKSVV